PLPPRPPALRRRRAAARPAQGDPHRRGVPPRARPPRDGGPGAEHAGTDPPRARHRGAEGALHPGHAAREDPLVPGLQRAGRGQIGGSHLTRRTFDGLVMLARALEVRGRPAIQDPVVRSRLVELEARLFANEYQGYRLLTLSARGEEPGLAALVMKLASTTLGYDIAKLAMEVI